jgi:hypothetical protein
MAAFENRTKSPQYEGLEKNAVSRRKSPKSAVLSYGANSSEGCFYWAFWGK